MDYQLYSGILSAVPLLEANLIGAQQREKLNDGKHHF
jgi:hypothetical protein